MSLNTQQDIGQVLVGVHPCEEAAGDDGAEDGCVLTGLLVADELPVFPEKQLEARVAQLEAKLARNDAVIDQPPNAA